MQKNLGFTLVEVLVAVTLTGVILLTGYSAFQNIMESQASLGATIDVQKNLFYTNEKLASLIREGGTIDYEEYFNRKRLGYDQSVRTEDNTFTFTNYSHFGNGNNMSQKQTLYYCGVSAPTGEECLGTSAVFDASLYPDTPPGSPNATIPVTTSPSTLGHQPYGQYEALAYNYLDPAGYPMPIKLPPIISSSNQIKIAERAIDGTVSSSDKYISDIGLPELYLIKKNLDNTYTRTYFRHVYVQDTFVSTPCNPLSGSLEGCLGKIQITKLDSCEVGTPDGMIDAWIPSEDFWLGSGTWSCNDIVPDAASIYSGAHEQPLNSGTVSANLTWVDVTSPDINVVRATFLPNPLKIPALMSGAGDNTEAPSVSIYIELSLSAKLRSRSFIRENMNYPRVLITTYDLSE